MKFGGPKWIRWPIGVAAVYFSFKMVFSASGGLGAIGGLLVGMSLLVVAAVCFCPEVVGVVAGPFFRWIDSIYLPGGRPDRAPLSFRLSDYYTQTRQFDLAVAEYQRILEDYPEEPQAYAGLVRLLDSELEDRKSARRWLKRGLRRVPKDGRTILLSEFAELC